MKALETWVARERRRLERMPQLGDALLGSRPLAYVAHRLRFATVRIVLRTTLHIVEVVALTRVFSPEYLGPILLLRHATLLASSAYWGVLEAQRSSLRDARRRRDDAGFAAIRSRWQAAAVIVIVLEQLPIVAFLWLAPRAIPGFSIYDAYAIACGIRLGLDTWARTKHSAVFAVARVRRPLWSMVVIDVVEVFGLLIAWLEIGPFAFALMLIVTGILRAASTLWFVERTSAEMGLPRSRRTIGRELWRGGWRQLPVARALRHAALNLLLQIDSLVIVVLAGGIAGRPGLLLSMAMHALSPLFGAGFTWTRLFYFDFARLRSYACPLLVARFGRLLDAVALVYPALLAILVIPLAEWLLPGLILALPVLLIAFVVARSLFALRQLEAFSYGDYRVQLRQSAVLFGSFAVFVALGRQLDVLLIGASLSLAAAAVVGRRAAPTRAIEQSGQLLCFEQFVGWLRQQPGELRLVAITVNRRLTSVGKLRSALDGCEFLGPSLQLDRQRLLFVVPGARDERELRAWFAAKSAGTLSRIEIGSLSPSGRAACKWLIEYLHASDSRSPSQPEVAPTNEHEILEGLRPAGASSPIEVLARDFATGFPDGVRLTSNAGSMRPIGANGGRVLPVVLAAMSGNRPRVRRRSDSVEVATYRPNGEAEQLYLLPRRSPQQPAFAAFRQRVEAASREASLRNALASREVAR